MANIEPIDLEYYPIWDKQPSEPEEKFLLFQRFFLPLPKANLTEAYRRFVADSGKEESGRKIDDAPGQWKRDCEQYRWRERHTAYWLKKTHENREWREQKIREYQAENLDTAALLKQRAEEILTNFDLAQAGPKDACQMLRLSKELTEEALSLTDLDKAALALFRAGFEITVPGEDWATTSLAEIGGGE
jgi:hypothetical protein